MLGPVELVDEVDSTNRVLLDRARAGAPHGLVLVADHQTAGRGRLGRTWEAKPGSALLVSVLLRPRLTAEELHLLTLAGALAACEACRDTAGVDVALKWPNDVVVEHDGTMWKLAGLLAESLLVSGEVSAVVLGMGMNLADLPLPEGAVALQSMTTIEVSRDAVLERWLQGLDRWLTDWDAIALLNAYRQRCSTIGRRVRVELVGQAVEGDAVDVDNAGCLLVKADTGVRTFAVGDVTHLRSV